MVLDRWTAADRWLAAAIDDRWTAAIVDRWTLAAIEDIQRWTAPNYELDCWTAAIDDGWTAVFNRY